MFVYMHHNHGSVGGLTPHRSIHYCHKRIFKIEFSPQIIVCQTCTTKHMSRVACSLHWSEAYQRGVIGTQDISKMSDHEFDPIAAEKCLTGGTVVSWLLFVHGWKHRQYVHTRSAQCRCFRTGEAPEPRGYIPKESKEASAEQRSTGNCASGEGLKVGTALTLDLVLGTDEKLSMGETMLAEACGSACIWTGTASAVGIWLADKICWLSRGKGIWMG